MTDRKMAEAQLRHDAHHDTLTGLPNRAVRAPRLARCVARRKSDPIFRYAVMFLDVDRFKVINDSLGHLAALLAIVGCSSEGVREEN